MKDWLKDVLQGRPWWMNVLMIFSAYMALIYVPWDFFVKPVAEDHEVWFGFTFTGVWAKWDYPTGIEGGQFLSFQRSAGQELLVFL